MDDSDKVAQPVGAGEASAASESSQRQLRACVRIQCLARRWMAVRRATAIRRMRTGAFNGRVNTLARLFRLRRLTFAREGASARIAHAFRVHAFRKRCKHGLQRT
mgnify:CR=1 FL=1